MTVYVLMAGCIDDEHIDSIHATKEKAQAEKERLNAESAFNRTVPKWIEEWEVK